MKKVLSFFLTVALLVTTLAVPALAAEIGASIREDKILGESKAYVWNFAKNAETAGSFYSLVEEVDGSSISCVAGEGLKVVANDDTLGGTVIDISDVPDGKYYAKISYKFNSISLTGEASNAVEAFADFGDNNPNFANFSVEEGSTEVTVTPVENIDAITVSGGAGLQICPANFKDYNVNFDFVLSKLELFTKESDRVRYDNVVPTYVLDGSYDVSNAKSGGGDSRLGSEPNLDGKKVLKINQYAEGSDCYNIEFGGIDKDIVPRNKPWYVTIKYKFHNNSTLATNLRFIHANFDGASMESGMDNVNGWRVIQRGYPTVTTASGTETLSKEWHVTAATKTPASNNADGPFCVNFNGITGNLGAINIEYIAFFDNAEDAAKFDIPEVKFGSKVGSTDVMTNSVELNLQPKLSIDEIKASTVVSNGFKFDDSDWRDVSNDDTVILEKDIVLKTDASTKWTLTVRSDKTAKPLSIIDATKLTNIEDIFQKPDNSRETGFVTVGGTQAAYFKRNSTDNGVNDNWCKIPYDTSKVDFSKQVYVKFAYRFGDDAVATTVNQQKQLHFYYPGVGGASIVGGPYGDDNIQTLRKGWHEVVVKASIAKAPIDTAKDNLIVGTFGIVGKVMFKYIAFFDNEEAAKEYEFGDLDADITATGKNITAAFKNAEQVSEYANRILAIYNNDGTLAKVVTGQRADEITAENLPAGTYKAKAFVWNNFNDITPLFAGAKEEITIE